MHLLDFVFCVSFLCSCGAVKVACIEYRCGWSHLLKHQQSSIVQVYRKYIFRYFQPSSYCFSLVLQWLGEMLLVKAPMDFMVGSLRWAAKVNTWHWSRTGYPMPGSVSELGYSFVLTLFLEYYLVWWLFVGRRQCAVDWEFLMSKLYCVKFLWCKILVFRFISKFFLVSANLMC